MPGRRAAPPPDLRTELSRLARLRHLQGALPPVLRGAPALALAAGALAARLVGAARNPVEDRLLGPVGTIELAPPPKPEGGKPPRAPTEDAPSPGPEAAEEEGRRR